MPRTREQALEDFKAACKLYPVFAQFEICGKKYDLGGNAIDVETMLTMTIFGDPSGNYHKTAVHQVEFTKPPPLLPWRPETKEEPKIGDVFKRYDGETCVVIMNVDDAQTGQKRIVYYEKSCNKGIWTMLLKLWLEPIKGAERFTFVENIRWSPTGIWL